MLLPRETPSAERAPRGVLAKGTPETLTLVFSLADGSISTGSLKVVSVDCTAAPAATVRDAATHKHRQALLVLLV